MSQPTIAFHCVICADEGIPTLVQEAVKGDQHNMLKVVRCTACGHYQLNPPNYSIDHYKEDGQVNFVVHDYGTPIEKIVEHSWIEAARRVKRFTERASRWSAGRQTSRCGCWTLGVAMASLPRSSSANSRRLRCR